MPVPTLKRYTEKNSLRPNPQTAVGRARFPFVQETINIGHFDSWDASASITNGLPPDRKPTPGALGALPEVPEVVKPYKNFRRPAHRGP